MFKIQHTEFFQYSLSCNEEHQGTKVEVHPTFSDFTPGNSITSDLSIKRETIQFIE